MKELLILYSLQLMKANLKKRYKMVKQIFKTGVTSTTQNVKQGDTIVGNSEMMILNISRINIDQGLFR